MQECSLQMNSAHIFPLSYDVQSAGHQIAIKQNVSGAMQAPKPMTGRKMRRHKRISSAEESSSNRNEEGGGGHDCIPNPVPWGHQITVRPRYCSTVAAGLRSHALLSMASGSLASGSLQMANLHCCLTQHCRPLPITLLDFP